MKNSRGIFLLIIAALSLCFPAAIILLAPQGSAIHCITGTTYPPEPVTIAGQTLDRRETTSISFESTALSDSDIDTLLTMQSLSRLNFNQAVISDTQLSRLAG